MAMNERNIDFETLVLAWQDESPDTAYYLDIDSGNVIMVQQGFLDRDDLTDMIERDRERYLYLPKPERQQMRRDLQDFIGGCSDAHLKSILEVACEAPDPLFACKTVLTRSGPSQLESWEQFRLARTRSRIDEWLAANFIKQGNYED
jgi:hypothetical protein